MVVIVAIYSAFTSWILPFVELPKAAYLFLNLPKLPLAWAAAIFLLGIAFIFAEGGYRLHQQSTTDHAKHIEEMCKRNEKRILAADWQGLADRFKRIDSAVRADWFRDTNGSESWRICGGFVKECESLCKLGAAMLASSPRVLGSIPIEIQSEADPIVRWLRFLQETGAGKVDNLLHGVATGPNGKEIGTSLGGSINSLGQASSIACLDCAAKETYTADGADISRLRA